MRAKLIQAGIKHLKEYGYPKVDAANIMIDPVYSAFFKKMLEGTLDDAGKLGSQVVTTACRSLIAEIDSVTASSLKQR